MPTIANILSEIEKVAPLMLQENYDNAGLIVGNNSNKVSNVLLCIDATEAVVDEAIKRNCNLIVAHHPIVFGGLKKLNGKNYVEKSVIKAIKNDVAIYACHTNIDNILHKGVNMKIAEKLGLNNCRILSPKRNQYLKLITYVPVNECDNILNAMFKAGAGTIGNYSHCSFSSPGYGTFKAPKGSKPFVGEIGKTHTQAEQKIELILPTYLKNKVETALIENHPYEEVAFEFSFINKTGNIGAGLIGELEKEMTVDAFKKHIKTSMNLSNFRFAKGNKKLIRTVALCGGSGSFLTKNALQLGSDAYITGDIKYHEFFDNENAMFLADIGHYESEQFTTEIFYDIISKKFPTFAVHFSETRTNPIFYYQ